MEARVFYNYFSKASQTIKNMQKLSLLILMICFCLGADCFAADPGISKNEILIGQSCALTGPASGLGKSYLAGADAYFKNINDSGGIKGRKIKLITTDDGYEPEKCKQNTTTLIETDKVFMLFGYVGTPTSKAALPIVEQSKIPFFAPMTGAEAIRKPFSKYVFNIRASYSKETKELVDRLINEKKMRKIAVFYQDDDFGKSGFEGVKAAMEQYGEKIVATGTYTRNTIAVEKAVKEISSKAPDAIIMIGTYEPCAEFIKEMRVLKSKALFLNISFVGSEILADKLREKGEGIGTIISQIVPFPNYLKMPIAKEFNDVFEKYNKGKDVDSIGFEGFIAAKTLCKIFSEMPESMTREDFIKTAESQQVDLGGFNISFDHTNHQGSNLVFLTQIGPGGYLTRIENLHLMYEYSMENPY